MRWFPFALATLAACSAAAPGVQPLAHDASPGDDGGTRPSPDAGAGDGAASPDAPSSPPVTVTDAAGAVTIDNGLLTIRFDEKTGRADYAWGAFTAVSGAYASVDLGGTTGYVTTLSYAAHALASVDALQDARGTGKRVTVRSTAPGRPDIDQIFSVYEGARAFFVDEHVVSPSPIASNYLGAIIVDPPGGVRAAPGPDPRILDVPFDNDAWVRFDSRVLGNAEFSGTGYEVAAVYEATSRRGLVVGSVTHDFWKTGIYYDVAGAQVARMNVWGGAATPDVDTPYGPTYGKDGTHDVARHGAMQGTTLASPTVFVGFYDDWRDGMEAFGAANAVTSPPRAWSGGPPFGWNSWGAFGERVTAALVEQTSDVLAAKLAPAGFSDQGVVYVNVDAGLGGDPTPVVQHIHANGQRAGTYRAPFAYFPASGDPAPLTRAAGGTGYTFGDLVLRDDANAPIQRSGGYALDVTHPGTKALVAAEMASVVSQGFDYVKLDFLTHGSLEGRHHDPAVATGMQAYNQAMAAIAAALPPNVFVSESIAPLFPGGYAHARRISCDVLGQLDDVMEPAWPHYGSTEYMLESLTYGWWMQGSLTRYDDPDGMALVSFEGKGPEIPLEWARTRVVASAVAGTVFLDATDYTSGDGAARAGALLTSAGLDALARLGRSFRPLDGDTGRVTAPIPNTTAVNAGSASADTFVLADGDAAWVALFDFDAQNAATRTIDLARVGLDPAATYHVTQVDGGASLGDARGTWSITLPPGHAEVVRFAR